MIKMFAAIARSLLSTLESIATPCSVNAYGRYRLPPYPAELEVAICDLKISLSPVLSLNMKSAGNRLRLRRTASVEPLRRHAVERRKVCVEHHAFATDHVDPRLDPGSERLGRHTDVIGLPLLG